MKPVILLVLAAICSTCDKPGRNKIQEADSANRIIRERNLVNPGVIVIDSASSAFLARAARLEQSLLKLSDLERQYAVNLLLKDFAGRLFRSHGEINSRLQHIAFTKQVVLPAATDNNSGSDEPGGLTGSDRDFITLLVKAHRRAISIYDRAQLETRDLDIRAFAGSILPVLKSLYDSARILQAKIR